MIHDRISCPYCHCESDSCRTPQSGRTRDDNGLMAQPPELPDSDVTALAGNIFATLTGSYRSNLSESNQSKEGPYGKTGWLSGNLKLVLGCDCHTGTGGRCDSNLCPGASGVWAGHWWST